jgi:hypothetical protein
MPPKPPQLPPPLDERLLDELALVFARVALERVMEESEKPPPPPAAKEPNGIGDDERE